MRQITLYSTTLVKFIMLNCVPVPFILVYHTIVRVIVTFQISTELPILSSACTSNSPSYDYI